MENCLKAGQFLLLLDGVNEISSGQAGIKSLQALRDKCGAWTPMIFSSREALGGSALTFSNRLEMEPLSEKQIKSFAEAYLSKAQAAVMLRALEPHMKELAETPCFL